jgi:hypothetical protein
MIDERTSSTSTAAHTVIIDDSAMAFSYSPDWDTGGNGSYSDFTVQYAMLSSPYTHTF